MTLVDVIGWAFTAFVTVSCVRYLASGDLRDDYRIFLGRTTADWLRVFGGSGLVVATTITVGTLLYVYGPEPVRWSWLNLIATKGEQGTNLNVAGAKIPYFGIAFILLLMLNFPRLARYEEEAFREGTRDWKDAVPRSLKFGFMHCIVGVPLGLGLVLAMPGMWFTYQYFRGGVDRSTLYHSVYNMMLGTLFLAYAIGQAVPR